MGGGSLFPRATFRPRAPAPVGGARGGGPAGWAPVGAAAPVVARSLHNPKINIVWEKKNTAQAKKGILEVPFCREEKKRSNYSEWQDLEERGTEERTREEK